MLNRFIRCYVSLYYIKEVILAIMRDLFLRGEIMKRKIFLKVSFIQLCSPGVSQPGPPQDNFREGLQQGKPELVKFRLLTIACFIYLFSPR